MTKLSLNNLLKKTIIKAKRRKIIKTDRDECIIFGSGPSMNTLDPDSAFFNGKDIIGCNFINTCNALKDKHFTLFSMIDRDYTKKVDESYFKNLHCDHFLVSTKNADLLTLKCLAKPNLIIVKTKPYNVDEVVNTASVVSGTELLTGNSLPFLIQCAAFLAQYKTIYLYGVDHYAEEDLGDSNNYSGYEGREVKDLSMTREKLDYINALYAVVKNICDAQGIKVLNATPHTKLCTFPTVSIS